MTEACVLLLDWVSCVCSMFAVWDEAHMVWSPYCSCEFVCVITQWLLSRVWAAKETLASLPNPRKRRHTDSSHFTHFFPHTALSPFYPVYNLCPKPFFTTFLHVLTVCPLFCLWAHFSVQLTFKSLPFPSVPPSFSPHPHSYSSSTISSPLWPLLSVCLSFSFLISPIPSPDLCQDSCQEPRQICSAWLF